MGLSGSILAGHSKGAQLPAAPREARKLLVYGTIQLPAMRPSNTGMSVHQRSQVELLIAIAHNKSPTMHVCLCTETGENQDESQPDLETEKGPNR